MQIALALWQEFEQPSPAGNLFVQTAEQLLAIHMVRHYAAGGATWKTRPRLPAGLTDRQLKRVEWFIRDHLSEEVSLDALAQQVGLSPHHFALLFRRTTGLSPHQFVLRQRLECVRYLLKETEVAIGQIALRCGFTDQSHMTRAFKQAHGCTPRAYRQDHATRHYLQ
jgi:AraC family transcriptional regulator